VSDNVKGEVLFEVSSYDPTEEDSDLELKRVESIDGEYLVAVRNGDRESVIFLEEVDLWELASVIDAEVLRRGKERAL
jgi:hypothetical protein